MLPLTEEVAGAPQPQVFFRDLEAVSGLCHDLQPLAGLLVLVVGNQDAVGLVFAPTHPATELVELGEAEPLRVLNDHDGGIGHVHAHLDDRGGHQDVRLVGGKGRHDRVLLLGLHLAVDEGHLQIGKHFALELLRVLRDSLPLVGQLVVFRDHGADDIGLPPLRRQLADEAVYPLVVAAGNGVGLHRLPSGGKLVDDGDLQVAVQNEGQGPGDRGGGHDQGVGMLPLGGQGRPLSNTEAVLLVCDHQPQVAVGDAFGDEGVGADGEVDFPRHQLFRDGALRFRRGGAGQQGTPDA